MFYEQEQMMMREYIRAMLVNAIERDARSRERPPVTLARSAKEG